LSFRRPESLPHGSIRTGSETQKIFRDETQNEGRKPTDSVERF
jgi:hypothetical protein